MLKSPQKAQLTPAPKAAAAAIQPDFFADLRQELQADIAAVSGHLASHDAEIAADKILKSKDIQGKLAGKLAQWVNEVHTPMSAPQLPVSMQLHPALSNQLQFFMRLYNFHQNPTLLQQDLLWLMVAAQPVYAKMLPVLLSSREARETHRFDQATLNQLLQESTGAAAKKIEEKKASPTQRVLDIFTLEEAPRHEALLVLMNEVHHHIDKMEAKLCAPQARIDQCTSQQLLKAIEQDKEYMLCFDLSPIHVLTARNQLIIPTYCKIAESLTKEQQASIVKSDYLVRLLQSLVLALFGAYPEDELQNQIIQMQQLLSKKEDIERYIRFIVALFAEGRSKVSAFNSIDYDPHFSTQWLALLCVLAALHKDVNLKHYLSYDDVCVILSGWHDYHALLADHPRYPIALFDKLRVITNMMKPSEQKAYFAEQFADKSRSIIWLVAAMQLPLSTEAVLYVVNQMGDRHFHTIYDTSDLIKYLPVCFSSFLKESPQELAIQLRQSLKKFRGSIPAWTLISLLMRDQTAEVRPLAELLISELLKEEYPDINLLAIMSPYFSEQQRETFFSLLNVNAHHWHSYGGEHLIDFILSNPHTSFNQRLLPIIIPRLLKITNIAWVDFNHIAKIYPLLSPAEKEQALILLIGKYNITGISIFITQRIAESMSPDLLIRLAESIIDQLHNPANKGNWSLAKYATSILSYLSSCLGVMLNNAPSHAKINEISRKIQHYYIATGQISAEALPVNDKQVRMDESAAAGSAGIRFFDRSDADKMDTATEPSQALEL